jgi:RimJ/RimL family protein N-acetyltransferase
VETCGELIGFGGVTHAKDRDALNLSYHLHPDSWGKGLATELVGAVLDVAFSLLMSERVVGLARPANPASCRVLEKTGFIFEQEIELHGASTRLYAISRPSFPE